MYWGGQSTFALSVLLYGRKGKRIYESNSQVCGGVYWKSENTDGDEKGFSLSYGIGAKMTLNETTKIRAEWEKIEDIDTSSNEKSDINILSIGVELQTF